MRLHRIDENISGEVAPLLAYLRELQRRYHVAVVLVHHARKGGAKMRAGQTLRGSSEFHAWVTRTSTSEPTVEQRILAQLETAAVPLTATVLRKLCQVQNATLQTALAVLVADGRPRRDRAGYALAR